MGGKPAAVVVAVTPRPAPPVSARAVAFHLQPVTALRGWERCWDFPVEAGDVKLLAFSVLAGTLLFSSSTGQGKLIASKDVLCGLLVGTHGHTQHRDSIRVGDILNNELLMWRPL